MDFANTYTKEQEQFREEVQAWIKANVPENMRAYDGMFEEAGNLTPEMRAFWKEKHLELGEKGWLYPTYPEEYGGGGLTANHETILTEEFRIARVVPHHADHTTIDALLVWGTEEQKQMFLAPILRGEKTCHQKLTEPQSGADQANVRNRAVKDGDYWLITGQNVFISTYPDVDWLSGQALTDPDAPRHRNTGFFLIDNPSEGLTIVEMNLAVGHMQKFVFMDSVRVPADHLIGGPTEGWQVMSTLLETEHGGAGSAAPEDPVADNLITYMQERRKSGDLPGTDPVIRQKAVEAWIDAHIDGLMSARTHWMYMSRKEMSWEGPTGVLFNRWYHLRNVARVRDVMGMYAQLGRHDPLAPFGGENEIYQRTRFERQHGAGSLNITKVVVARRIGISRTKERAAVTPMTAMSRTS